ncbi:hypothetical protein [Bradyrhizobium sp. F1.13.3]|uniref:hypothetical protein n=1 Tax=Bradyrhizobium sp. F1.13.3 TaxID=3156351 RepID=UPI00339376FB
MWQIREEDEQRRQHEAAAILADLGREPNAAERILVAEIAALVVRADRERAKGKHGEAEMCSRLIIRALGKLGVKPGKAKPTSSADIIARITGRS